MVGLSISMNSASAYEATATVDVNVRNGPGGRFAKVDVLLKGVTVNVAECKSGWCHVKRPNVNGWVYNTFLLKIKNSNNSAGESGDDSPSSESPPELTTPTEPGACKRGYVWREAVADDYVCVRPAQRTLAAKENRLASWRVDPAGKDGPESCRSGFVWREALDGDVVCVTPARRTQVQRENANGPSLRVQAP